MGSDVRTARVTEPDAVVEAHDRDVEPDAVQNHRQRDAALILRAMHVQALARAGHVRQDDIVDPVWQRPASRDPLEEDWNLAHGRGQSDRADRHLRQARLDVLHRVTDGLEALAYVVDVRAKRDGYRGDGIPAFDIPLLVQGDRHGADDRLVGERVYPLQIAPQRAAADDQRHVVDRAAERLAHALDTGEVEHRMAYFAPRRDGSTEDRLGRPGRQRRVLQVRDEREHVSRAMDRAAEKLPSGARCQRQPLEQAPGWVRGLRRLSASRPAQVPDWSGGSIVRVRRVLAAEQAHGRRTVRERVVDLGVRRETAVAQAFDQVDLPHRPAAIQWPLVQSCQQLLEFRFATGAGQGDAEQVLIQVDGVEDIPFRPQRR